MGKRGEGDHYLDSLVMVCGPPRLAHGIVTAPQPSRDAQRSHQASLLNYWVAKHCAAIDFKEHWSLLPPPP